MKKRQKQILAMVLAGALCTQGISLNSFGGSIDEDMVMLEEMETASEDSLINNQEQHNQDNSSETSENNSFEEEFIVDEQENDIEAVYEEDKTEPETDIFIVEETEEDMNVFGATDENAICQNGHQWKKVETLFRKNSFCNGLGKYVCEVCGEVKDESDQIRDLDTAAQEIEISFAAGEDIVWYQLNVSNGITTIEFEDAEDILRACLYDEYRNYTMSSENKLEYYTSDEDANEKIYLMVKRRLSAEGADSGKNIILKMKHRNFREDLFIGDNIIGEITEKESGDFENFCFTPDADGVYTFSMPSMSGIKYDFSVEELTKGTVYGDLGETLEYSVNLKKGKRYLVNLDWSRPGRENVSSDDGTFLADWHIFISPGGLAVDFTDDINKNYGWDNYRNVDVIYGENVELQVNACSTSGNTLSYQWEEEDSWDKRTIIAGENSPSLVLSFLTEDKDIFCVVRDGMNTKELHFGISVKTSLHERSQNNAGRYYVHKGDSLVLDAATESSITGSNLTYTWKKYLGNETPYTDDPYQVLEERSSQLVVNNITEDAMYVCYVSDAYNEFELCYSIEVVDFYRVNGHTLKQGSYDYDYYLDRNDKKLYINIETEGRKVDYEWYGVASERYGGYEPVLGGNEILDPNGDGEILILTDVLGRADYLDVSTYYPGMNTYFCKISSENGVIWEKYYISGYKEIDDADNEPEIRKVDLHGSTILSLPQPGENYCYSWFCDNERIEGEWNNTLSVENVTQFHKYTGIVEYPDDQVEVDDDGDPYDEEYMKKEFFVYPKDTMIGATNFETALPISLDSCTEIFISKMDNLEKAFLVFNAPQDGVYVVYPNQMDNGCPIVNIYDEAKELIKSNGGKNIIEKYEYIGFYAEANHKYYLELTSYYREVVHEFLKIRLEEDDPENSIRHYMDSYDQPIGIIHRQPTCQQEGVYWYMCPECFALMEVKKIPAIVHSWSAWKKVDDITEERSCSVCGEKQSRQIEVLEPKPADPVTPVMPTHPIVPNNNTTLVQANVASAPLGFKQSTTKLQVLGMAPGDYVVSWTSSNSKIAKVSASGKVTAQKKAGTAVITATLASGKTVEFKIKTQKAKVKTKKIKGLSKKMTVKVKSKTALHPVIEPITSSEKITYSSSNKKIAAVNKKGVITAKKAGKVKIKVKSGKKKFTITVKVVK